ncbi:dihydrofolate reductase family protein [Robertkochia solimangrovi]|uniref:dihydrofolate reductase family protein n=1 Tax=Robertkochia solimangrovi TaxID=2213046 RepID=UPI00117DC33D|nr:dihydrofolate reductase family protein [Robertkochia solimangrovi]TRZ41831.1 dihydrofolate reductase [Robertkochia solimangrovi]
MRRIISFVHISLDGFVAGPNGEMNWIKLDEELFDHIGMRISKSNAGLYGRKTYELMEDYWPTAADNPNATKHDIEHSAWYARAHKFVISHSLKGSSLENTTIIGEDLTGQINELRQQEGKELLLFGSPTTTHALLRLNLIDGFWFFVNPVVLGEGIPLFEGVKDPLKLKLQSTKRFASGVTELSYSVVRS